jgi:Sec-independent protein secretion pathway component TatC
MSAETSREGSRTCPEGAPDGVKMTIWEHLGELRKRVIRAAIGVIVTTIVGWASA